MENRKWTIGIVNYKSSVYLEYQMKILYEFNDPNSFKIIIIDNSFPHQIEELSRIAETYRKYGNMEIIYFDASQDPWMRGSGQHGQGLNEVLKRADTDYLLVHDPDFFFVHKNYLKILERKLNDGNLVIGAPYRHWRGHIETGKIGNPDFPSAFGAAYKISAIEGLDFMPAVSKELFKSGVACWIEPEGADVGWQMRDKLSNKPYVSFQQQWASMMKYYFGDYSFQQEPYEYFLDGKRIAYHLFRGTFVADDRSFSASKIDKSTPEEWNRVREKCAQYFYNVAKNGISPMVYIKIYWVYYIQNIMIIDEILDKIIYIPTCKIFKFLNRLFFKLTHPVAFIKRKIKKLKVKN